MTAELIPGGWGKSEYPPVGATFQENLAQIGNAARAPNNRVYELSS